VARNWHAPIWTIVNLLALILPVVMVALFISRLAQTHRCLAGVEAAVEEMRGALRGAMRGTMRGAIKNGDK
jgi:hypothetical protein